jgi:hypothetical protein
MSMTETLLTISLSLSLCAVFTNSIKPITQIIRYASFDSSLGNSGALNARERERERVRRET